MEYESLWVVDEPMAAPSERLKFLLRLDKWPSKEALWTLLGVDPAGVGIGFTLDGDGYPQDYYVQSIRSFGGQAWVVFDSELDLIEKQYDLLTEIWDSGNHSIENSPDYYILWAISKGFDVPWLPWAKERGLISAEIPIEFSPPGKLLPDGQSDYISDDLAYLKQAAFMFWARVDRGNKAEHPDNDEVARWLIEKGYSPTTAKIAASIIRPVWAAKGRKPENE